MLSKGIPTQTPDIASQYARVQGSESTSIRHERRKLGGAPRTPRNRSSFFVHGTRTLRNTDFFPGFVGDGASTSRKICATVPTVKSRIFLLVFLFNALTRKDKFAIIKPLILSVIRL